MTFTIEMLPARHGDALIIEHAPSGGRTTRIMIDGGPGTSYSAIRSRLSTIVNARECIDLLIITHVDTDHIDGAITLLLDDIGIEIKEIWFNGRAHSSDPHNARTGDITLGGVQGQILTWILGSPTFINRWNTSFGGRAIVAPSSGFAFPTATVGPLMLTILSPCAEQLTKLAAAWNTDVMKALVNLELLPSGATAKQLEDALAGDRFDVARQLLAARFEKRLHPPPGWVQPSEDDVQVLGDQSKPNGSSIAVLIETVGDERAEPVAALFTGDAHASVLDDTISRLNARRNRTHLRLDAFKVAHHGSKNNVSRALLGRLNCRRYLFSTDGSHGFDHPDDVAITKILDAQQESTELFFNYLSHRTDPAVLPAGKYASRYTPFWPPQGRGEHGLKVSV